MTTLIPILFEQTVVIFYISFSDQNQLLTSFSLGRNILQLIAFENNPDSLPCIYGLRVIALAWIVLAHRLVMEISVPKTSFRGVSDVSYETEGLFEIFPDVLVE